MNLRAWNSNNKHFLNTIRPELRNMKHSVSVLGTLWDTITDTITVSVPPPLDPDIRLTLRLILVQSAKVYDILGLWTPITIKSKILMQDIRVRVYDEYAVTKGIGRPMASNRK